MSVGAAAPPAYLNNTTIISCQTKFLGRKNSGSKVSVIILVELFKWNVINGAPGVNVKKTKNKNKQTSLPHVKKINIF